jgi:hypothetical protein
MSEICYAVTALSPIVYSDREETRIRPKILEAHPLQSGLVSGQEARERFRYAKHHAGLCRAGGAQAYILFPAYGTNDVEINSVFDHTAGWKALYTLQHAYPYSSNLSYFTVAIHRGRENQYD